jgi:hypothetical protein
MSLFRRLFMGGFKSGGLVHSKDAKLNPDSVAVRLSPADERWLRPGERWSKREGSAVDEEMAKLVERQSKA